MVDVNRGRREGLSCNPGNEGVCLSRLICHCEAKWDRYASVSAAVQNRGTADGRHALEGGWKAPGDTVDAWLDREAEYDRLTSPGAAECRQVVSGSADPAGGSAPQS